jgi:membrane protein DedA with SNARE-associated domain
MNEAERERRTASIFWIVVIGLVGFGLHSNWEVAQERMASPIATNVLLTVIAMLLLVLVSDRGRS